MTNFLLIFSIMLNVLAFLCIALLFIRQNRIVTMESKQDHILKEMEEVVSTFISEIKEENESLLQKIKQMDPSKNETITSDETEENIPLKVLSQKPVQINKYKENQGFHKETGVVADQQDDVEELLNLILPNKQEKKPKKTLLDEVVELYEQGKSVDEIAKELNKGKTEIQLLLKFRQNMQE